VDSPTSPPSDDSSKFKFIQPKPRKKWTPKEQQLFDQCFKILSQEVKDVRPKMIEKKLNEMQIDVTREQVASYLQVYTFVFILTF
jgi:SHAQKYF class myb-like DNA-binding protein